MIQAGPPFGSIVTAVAYIDAAQPVGAGIPYIAGEFYFRDIGSGPRFFYHNEDIVHPISQAQFECLKFLGYGKHPELNF